MCYLFIGCSFTDASEDLMAILFFEKVVGFLEYFFGSSDCLYNAVNAASSVPN